MRLLKLLGRRNLYGLLVALSLWLAGFITNYLNAESFPIGRIVGLFIFGLLFVLAFIEITENLNLSPALRIVVLITIFPTFFYHTADLIRARFEDIRLLNVGSFLTKDYLSLQIFKSNILSVDMILFLLFNVGILILWFNSSLGPRYRNFFLLWLNIFALVYGWRLLYLMASLDLILFFAVSTIFFLTDTFAYLGGRLLGRRLIKRSFANRISPQKTWEGFIAGLSFGLIASSLTFSLIDLDLKIWQQLLLIFLLPPLVVIGDLSFSLLKRRLLLNNFSDLIPGHGGLNDRFDGAYFLLVGLSLILTIPW